MFAKKNIRATSRFVRYQLLYLFRKTIRLDCKIRLILKRVQDSIIKQILMAIKWANVSSTILRNKIKHFDYVREEKYGGARPLMLDNKLCACQYLWSTSPFMYIFISLRTRNDFFLEWILNVRLPKRLTLFIGGFLSLWFFLYVYMLIKTDRKLLGCG